MLHNISAYQLDLLRSMDSYMESTVVPILKDVGACWQPTDFLPDPASDTFLDEVGLSQLLARIPLECTAA